jgi:bifunctional non-homologous end joining protein LigD
MKSSWTAFASWRDRDAAGVRLLTRRGIDWTTRYPSIAAAVAALACRSCLIDGEVVICGDDGIPVFDRLRYGRQPQTEAVLFAFDLLELGGKELRRTPLEERKAVPLRRRVGFPPLSQAPLPPRP